MANLALKGGTPVRNKPFTSWPIIGDEERKLLLEVFDSGVWSFGGPKEAEFAKKFAAFTGAKEALCVANGSVSLEIALRAAGCRAGGRSDCACTDLACNGLGSFASRCDASFCRYQRKGLVHRSGTNSRENYTQDQGHHAGASLCADCGDG